MQCKSPKRSSESYLRLIIIKRSTSSLRPDAKEEARNRTAAARHVDDGARALRRRRTPPDVPHVLVLPVRPRDPHHLLPVHRRLLPALLRPLPPRDRRAAAPRVPAAAALPPAPVPPAPPPIRRPPAPLGHIRRGPHDSARPRVPPTTRAGFGSIACTGTASAASSLLAAAAGAPAAVHAPGLRPRELLHGAEPEQPHRGDHPERPPGPGAGAIVGHRLAPDGADHRGAPDGRPAVPRVQGGLRARGGGAAAAVQARVPLRLHRAVAPSPQLLPGLPVPAARRGFQRRRPAGPGRTSPRRWWRRRRQEQGAGERASDDGAVGSILVAVAAAWPGRPRRRRVGARAPRQAPRRGRRRRILRLVALCVSLITAPRGDVIVPVK